MRVHNPDTSRTGFFNRIGLSGDSLYRRRRVGRIPFAYRSRNLSGIPCPSAGW